MLLINMSVKHRQVFGMMPSDLSNFFQSIHSHCTDKYVAQKTFLLCYNYIIISLYLRWGRKELGQGKILFVSCNSLKRNRVGRSVKNLFLHYSFFLSKMCILCMVYVDWYLGGRKKLEGRDFYE